ncbi:MAG: hypothetical protein FWH05_01125 [Oscillospiraceae bacterium]|nr:hypothetical protein [Oscillospiraceae bacterium]
MDKINEVSRYIQILLLLGVTIRVVFCFIRLQSAEEDGELYKKRLKHAVLFLLISQLVFIIKDIVVSYFG